MIDVMFLAITRQRNADTETVKQSAMSRGRKQWNRYPRRDEHWQSLFTTILTLLKRQTSRTTNNVSNGTFSHHTTYFVVKTMS